MKRFIIAVILVSVVTPAMASVNGFEDTTGLSFYSDPGASAARDSSIVRSGSYSVKLGLDDTDVYGRVGIDGNFGTLNGFNEVSFWSYITSGSPDNLAPYAMLLLDANNDGIYTSGANVDPYVIAFITGGATYPTDTWFETGMDMTTTVHVPLGRGDLTAGTYSASGTQDTLASLAGQIYGGTTTFGDLDIVQVRIGAGQWPSTGTVPYTAYVDDVCIDATAVVPAPGALLLGCIGSGFVGWLGRRSA